MLATVFLTRSIRRRATAVVPPPTPLSNAGGLSDLPEEGYSRLVRETKAAVYVELDAAALADLRSDAAYYSDAAMFERELSGLCASARATVRAIDRAAAQASDGVAA
jgi:hypothetical protein